MHLQAFIFTAYTSASRLIFVRGETLFLCAPVFYAIGVFGSAHGVFGLLFGVIATVGLATLVGFLWSKLSDTAFIIFSLGLLFASAQVVLGIEQITGGAYGISSTAFLFHQSIFIVPAISLLIIGISAYAWNTQHGVMVSAIGQDKSLARGQSVSPMNAQIKWMIGTGVLLMATGFLWGSWRSFADVNMLHLDQLILLITGVYLGGRRLWHGIGIAFLFALFLQAIRFLPFNSVIIGGIELVIIGFVLILVARWHKFITIKT